MADIVERLRKREILTEVGRDRPEIYRDAADEIERLRKDVKTAVLGDSAELTDAKKEIERLKDEITLIRKSIREYVSNSTRITNDMLREMWVRDNGAD